MYELISRSSGCAWRPRELCRLSGPTAEMSLAFAEVSGPDDLSRKLQVRADTEPTGKLLAHSNTTCLLVARLEGK